VVERRRKRRRNDNAGSLGLNMKNLVLIQKDCPSAVDGLALKARDALVSTENDASLRRITEPLCYGDAPGPVTLIVDSHLMDVISPPELIELKDAAAWAITAGVCFTIDTHLLVTINSKFDMKIFKHGAHLVALCPERLYEIGSHCGNKGDEVNFCMATQMVWLHEFIHWARGGVTDYTASGNTEESVTQFALWSLLLIADDECIDMRSMMVKLAGHQPKPYRQFTKLPRI